MNATPKITVESVSPEMAATLLGTMRGNRTLRKNIVQRYAREMIAGKWLLNGESIKVDSAGRLVDGQHRLNAVIMAKRAVVMCVVRGVESEAVITLDTGVGRSFGDWGVIGGRPYANAVGSVARWWYKYETGSPTVGYRPSHQELEVVIQAHPQITESTAFILKHRVLKSRCVASVQSFVHAYTSEHYDRELSDLFMEELETGVSLNEGSPVLALRRRLVDDAGPGRKVESTHVLAWTIKAWNAWFAGERVKRITWAPQGVGSGVELFPRFETRKPRDVLRLSEQARERQKRRAGA
jgi:hypothetical protein